MCNILYFYVDYVFSQLLHTSISHCFVLLNLIEIKKIYIESGWTKKKRFLILNIQTNNLPTYK